VRRGLGLTASKMPPLSMGFGFGHAAYEFIEGDANGGLCSLQESIPLLNILPFISGCSVPDLTTPAPELRDDQSTLCGLMPSMGTGCFDYESNTIIAPEEAERRRQEEAILQQQELAQQCTAY
jgi:hypothetical protein